MWSQLLFSSPDSGFIWPCGNQVGVYFDCPHVGNCASAHISAVCFTFYASCASLFMPLDPSQCSHMHSLQVKTFNTFWAKDFTIGNQKLMIKTLPHHTFLPSQIILKYSLNCLWELFLGVNRFDGRAEETDVKMSNWDEFQSHTWCGPQRRLLFLPQSETSLNYLERVLSIWVWLYDC